MQTEIGKGNVEGYSIRGLPARFPLKDCHWQSFQALQALKHLAKGPGTCFAILGLLRRPTPDLRALYTKLTCNPCSRNDVGLPTSMLRNSVERSETEGCNL